MRTGKHCGAEQKSRAPFLRFPPSNFLPPPYVPLPDQPREDRMSVQFCVRMATIFLFLTALPLFAQNQQDTVSSTVLQEDSVFWDAYNRCDVDKMSQFFWPDVEFYHDKGGPTIGFGPLVETFKKNLCGNPNFQIGRAHV